MTPPTLIADRELRAVLVLPFPPSVNNLFLNVPGRGRVRSPAYRKWGNEAGWAVQLSKQPKIAGPVSVLIELCAPDQRRRDADNSAKAILDLLVKHRIIEADDNRIVREFQVKWVAAGEPCVVTVRAA